MTGDPGNCEESPRRQFLARLVAIAPIAAMAEFVGKAEALQKLTVSEPMPSS